MMAALAIYFPEECATPNQMINYKSGVKGTAFFALDSMNPLRLSY
jgi:hypothetical protein